MRMCILPVGATEQHGPHLPVNVDTLAATFLSHEISRRTGVPVLPALAYGEDGSDVHANVAETSLLLAIAPELVRMDRAVDEPDRSEGRLFAYTVAEMSVSGVVGRPSAASREKGAALIEMIVTDLTDKV